MSEQLTNNLFISSMIFFNILCVLGIIACGVIIWAVFSIRKNTQHTLESIQETSQTITGVAVDINERFISKFTRPQKSWIDIALKLIQR